MRASKLLFDKEKILENQREREDFLNFLTILLRKEQEIKIYNDEYYTVVEYNYDASLRYGNPILKWTDEEEN